MDVKYGSSEENKKNKKIFDDLIKQYNALMEGLPIEEREQLENALLIYNSCLYEVINQLVAVPNFREQNPNELFEELLKNPDCAMTTKLFIRSLRFGQRAIESGDRSFDEDIYKKLRIVNCSSKEAYVQSLISIYDTIEKYKDKLQLPEDVYLYRGIGNIDSKEQSSMARSELISTSLNRNVANKFFRRAKEPIMFMAKVKKGTNFMIIPYKLTSKILSYRKGQELLKYNGIDYDNVENREVILFDSRIISKEPNISIIDEGTRRITVMELDIESRENEKSQKSVQDLWEETLSVQGEISYMDSTNVKIGQQQEYLENSEEVQE